MTFRMSWVLIVSWCLSCRWRNDGSSTSPSRRYIYIHCSDTTNDISAVYTMSRFSCHMTYIATQQFPGNSLAQRISMLTGVMVDWWSVKHSVKHAVFLSKFPKHNCQHRIHQITSPIHAIPNPFCGHPVDEFPRVFLMLYSALVHSNCLQC